LFSGIRWQKLTTPWRQIPRLWPEITDKAGPIVLSSNGLGRLTDDDLLFADIDGAPLSPNAISAAWSDYAKRIGMPEVTFHALRHTHAS
jgi:integrase